MRSQRIRIGHKNLIPLFDKIFGLKTTVDEEGRVHLYAFREEHKKGITWKEEVCVR